MSATVRAGRDEICEIYEIRDIYEFLEVARANHRYAMTTRFEPAMLVVLRHDLMRRGLVLSTLLADVLAGKRPPQLEALLASKPGKRPEEIIRGTLDQVERRRKQLDAGDDHYGRCDVCGVDLGLVALREMPWADRCAAHAGQ